VKTLRQLLAKFRRQKEALDYATAYHAEARARTHRLVEAAQGHQGMQENLALLGIDLSKAERPRLITLGGNRL